ncbi:hypothetical protein HUU40_13615 [candidate division KSB1 bacterium]|nr:hypothetical protein [candidate division KSB1 bacterium]
MIIMQNSNFLAGKYIEKSIVKQSKIREKSARIRRCSTVFADFLENTAFRYFKPLMNANKRQSLIRGCACFIAGIARAA